jgi:hypothetical protein
MIFEIEKWKTPVVLPTGANILRWFGFGDG